MPGPIADALAQAKPGPGKRLTRTLAKAYHRARFHIALRWRYNRLCVETVSGRPFIVLPDVFNPKLMITGGVFSEMLTPELIPSDSRVLELGTGTGVGAVQAASLGATIVALDINPIAVRNAHMNALMHDVEHALDVRQSDLFAAVEGEQFDVVVFHPPFYEGDPGSGLEQAWRYGDIPRRFADELAEHLAPGGYALLFLMDTGGWLTFLRELEARGFGCAVVDERDLGFEIARLFRIDPPTQSDLQR